MRYKHVQVGNLIKRSRISRGMTRTEFANFLGLRNPGQTIYNIEIGKCSPKFFNREQLKEIGITDTAFHKAIMQDFSVEARRIMEEVWS